VKRLAPDGRKSKYQGQWGLTSSQRTQFLLLTELSG
jgi:hypothetical protein